MTAPRVDVDELGRLLAELGGCPFDEQTADASMCRCGLPALNHNTFVEQIVMSDHPTVAALLAEVSELRATVARVEALAAEDRRNRSECAADENCPCAYKDCYDCGKWHNCTHTPYTAIRAALDGAS